MEETGEKIRGLTTEEVEKRLAEGQGNEIQNESSRSAKDIVLSNVFTLFNLINVILFVMVFTVFSWKNMAFMGVAFFNTIIGIIQELRAKKTLDELRILTASETDAVRDGRQVTIPVTQIVPEDVILLRQGQQIPADGVLLRGRIEVNESLLTGESDSIAKAKQDSVLSGSFVTAGKAICQVTKTGSDCYMEQIARQAKEHQKHNSALRNSINQILKTISIIIVPLGVLMFCKLYFVSEVGYKQAVLDTVAAVIGMIPEGLVLLTSVALALGVVRLAKRQTLVQELYCIETLARVDTLCLDKTGTLTEGRLEVERTLPKGVDTEQNRALTRLVLTLAEENETAKALQEYVRGQGFAPLDGECVQKIPFSSERKYSGASYAGEGTWYVGAYGFLFPAEEQDAAVQAEIAEYAGQGYRVLVMAHTEQMLQVEEHPSGLVLDAILLLTDVIRKEAPEILDYFRKQEVDVRIISGDDPNTVGAIAARCGLQDIGTPVDATTLADDEQMRQALAASKVFGRVKPAQKERMVELLKEEGHTVAMTGDGVNDVLALKKADCSIAMASGSDAAKNVSNVVLLDSNFASMPHIVNEGRRVINNIKMASSLFLVKTTFSIILAFMTIILGQAYPFQPVQLSIISMFAVGIPSFLLQLEPSFERIEPGFLRPVLHNAVPTALTIATFVFLVQNIGLLAGYSVEQLATACVLATGFNYTIAQMRVYSPMTHYRGMIIYSMQVLFLVTTMVIGRSFLDMTDLPLELVGVVLIMVQLSPVVTKGYIWLFERFLALRDRRIRKQRVLKEKREEKKEQRRQKREQRGKK